VNEAPNKARTVITLDLSALGAGKMVFEERFDGKTGYVIDSMQGNREVTGNHLDNLRNEMFPTPLLNYKERGETVELGGKETISGREAYLVILRPKSGPALRRYIDAESYLEVRFITTASGQQGDIEQTIDLLDQREVDGVKVPFAFKGTSDVQAFSVQVTKVEHNQTIDQSVFSRP
jgi:hypothetical protein